MKQFVLLGSLVSALSLLSLCLQPQLRAKDVITLVVSFSPGGVVDVVARAVADRMALWMPATIVIENKGGAGGNIAAQFVARAKPDGNTILAFNGGMLTVNPFMMSNLMFGHQDFAPITSLASTPNVIVVNKDTKASNIKDLIALAKADPESRTYATPGPGSSPHMCMELLGVETGVKFVHVPFKGAADAIREVVANRISIACINVLSVLPFVADGSLRPLAVTAKSRHPLLPDVPSVAEAGMPGLEAEGWYGLAAPAGTPKAVIDRLNVAAVKALRDPALAARLKELGLTPGGDSPVDFAKHINDEAVRWKEVVRKANISNK